MRCKRHLAVHLPTRHHAQPLERLDGLLQYEHRLELLPRFRRRRAHQRSTPRSQRMEPPHAESKTQDGGGHELPEARDAGGARPSRREPRTRESHRESAQARSHCSNRNSRHPHPSSKPAGRRSPSLGRFDSCAASFGRRATRRDLNPGTRLCGIRGARPAGCRLPTKLVAATAPQHVPSFRGGRGERDPSVSSITCPDLLRGRRVGGGSAFGIRLVPASQAIFDVGSRVLAGTRVARRAWAWITHRRTRALGRALRRPARFRSVQVIWHTVSCPIRNASERPDCGQLEPPIYNRAFARPPDRSPTTRVFALGLGIARFVFHPARSSGTVRLGMLP